MKEWYKWKKLKKDEKQAYKYVGLAVEFAIDLFVPIAMFGYIGHLIDKEVYGKNWVFFIIGILLGIAGGIYLVVRALIRISNEKLDDDSDSSNEHQTELDDKKDAGDV